MILPGHLAGGYLIGTAIVHFSGLALSVHDSNIIIGTSILASVACDFDLIYFFIKNKSAKLHDDKSHRDLISHAPFLWLILGLAVYAIGGTDLVKLIGLSIWLGTWTHFLSDSIEYGIMWFWPFSKKKYMLHVTSIKVPTEKSFSKFYLKGFREVYMKNWTFWLEITVIAIAAFVYFD